MKMKKAAAFFSIFLLANLIALPVMAEEAGGAADRTAQTEDSGMKKGNDSVKYLIIGGVVVAVVVVALANAGGSSSSAPQAQLPEGQFPDNPPDGPPAPQALAKINLGNILKKHIAIVIGRAPYQGQPICAIIPLAESRDLAGKASKLDLSVSSKKIAMTYGIEL